MISATLNQVAHSGQPKRSTYSGDFVLEVDQVTKAFPGVIALDNVSLRIRPGSVHVLMGENGAGKSTLMKIISGLYQPDSGTLRLRGKTVQLNSPLAAQRAGIAMIHQELLLMNSMTVAENIWIGREPRNRFGVIDHTQMQRQTEDLLQRLKLNLDAESEIQSLSMANRQMVEIAKAVSLEADVLIMDESTSSLTETEVEHLFAIVNDLRASGIGIVYITHKMNELFAIADEFTVFRDGKYVATHPASGITREAIIKLMVGREISQMFPKQPVALGEVVLSVDQLGLDGVFANVSFDLRAGEILGFAGLVGSGRSNVAETLFGITPATHGTIKLKGQPCVIDCAGTAIRHRLAMLTEDRKETGCFLPLNILENMQIVALQQGYSQHGVVREAAVEQACHNMAQQLRVKTPNLYECIENLSGGNQQKVLICRWLLTQPDILILDEPTRGIDVGAKAEIHRLIVELARTGVAIIMISSELPEVLGMSDRIVVMHEGQVTGIVDAASADQVTIMSLAAR
ncbi:sugar ABC transporter ATP-binding protein [Pantoea sp. A4]|uniref:sugar ABC transporter ATP-binding protein n=1 Tax=Pantoea sp. A4 TaxID=1225184 RepID=UPI0003784B55|nr:sugar ABC transporter ATP-binding protein [Pantoea sp. A4]